MDDRFVYLSYLLFGWGILHRVLLVVGWYWVSFSNGFLCGNSHHFIIPRARSSLVAYCLGVSAPSPKSQSLISGQEKRCHRCLAMALNEIKTNTQKWEIENEPQSCGSYKIRKIIIKIMEYTHTHTHTYTYTHKQNQSSPTKIKYNILAQETKETRS